MSADEPQPPPPPRGGLFPELDTPQLRWVAGVGATVVLVFGTLSFTTGPPWTASVTFLTILGTMLGLLGTGVVQTLRGTRAPER